jgi:chemotaxis protein CheD
MNHMLLPDAATDTLNQSAGAVDMELLINAMVRIGASRSSLRAKVFGGASMLSGITDIGARNARFATDYLKREGIACDGISTGGDSARQVKFWPESGAAKQRLVRDAPVIQRRIEVEVNDVELF